jgi:hypothetical protein
LRRDFINTLASVSLEGWQIVAGGRSEAQTTGRREKEISTRDGCQKAVGKA